MALTEQSIIGRTEVLPDGQIQVRRDDLILRDGVEISRTYHRHVLSPGDDLTGQDAQVVTIANAVWTEAVISAWQAAQVSRGV